MSTSFDKIMREEARLILLKELHSQPNFALSDALIQPVLESFGIARSRDWIRDEMRHLAELGAISVSHAGSVSVARLTSKGVEHVEARIVIEGVKRPSPKEF